MSDDNAIVLSASVDPIVYLVYNDGIRRVKVDAGTYYSLIDFVGYFSDTKQSPRQYWNDIKQSMVNRYGFQVSENIRRFKLLAPDGKMRLTDCGDIITIRRVIMSIPSHKAEPLRMWLAGKSDVLLQYREMMVLQGYEWAADTIKADNERDGYEYPEEDNDAWSDLGYIRD